MLIDVAKRIVMRTRTQGGARLAAVAVMLAGLAVAGCSSSASTEDPGGASGDAVRLEAARRIDIPLREHGYRSFETMAISTREEFNVFLDRVRDMPGWNRREAFFVAMESAAISFDDERLVIIRHDEPSGSNTVALAGTTRRGDVLQVHIDREEAGLGTADMAYYAFALVVPNAIVQVLVQRDGRPDETIDLE